MKTVSVIIPTFNRGQRIAKTISSVLNQDYTKIEIIIVDDGSVDVTASVVQKLSERNNSPDRSIRYFYQENSGACVARNRGLMLATGGYVMFLDSDDLIKESMLSAQVERIENEGSQCSICDFECIDEQGKIVLSFNNNRHPHEFIRNLISPSISTVLMRRDSLPPGLNWNANLKRIQDIDFMFKYFSSITKWSYVDQPLFQYCLHGDRRISDSYLKGVQYSILRNSFKTYIRNNTAFVTADPDGLYRAYARCLLKHQIKNAIISVVPSFLRKLVKRGRGSS